MPASALVLHHFFSLQLLPAGNNCKEDRIFAESRFRLVFLSCGFFFALQADVTTFTLRRKDQEFSR